MVSVDYVSKAIIYLSQQEESLGKAFHFVNPHPFHSHALINLLHSLGYPLQHVSYEQWQEKLFQIAATNPEHTLYPLVPLLLERVSSKSTYHSATLQFDCENTLAGLANTSLACPPIDEQLLHVYLSYLIHQGFLRKPETSEITDSFL
jgi:thioester reductase-like protein